MNNTIKKIVMIAGIIGMVGMVGTPALAAALTESQIDSILNLLESFGADTATIANVESALTGGTVTPTTPTVEGCTITSFDRNLKLGMSGDDVNCLQIVLNSDSETQLAASGVGSAGNETSYFGPLTKGAVIKFQEKYSEACLDSWGLTEGTGYVGSTTRAKLNELLGEVIPPVECTVDADCPAGYTCTAEVCVKIPVAAEGLTVALATDTPASAVIPSSATGVEFAKFAFSTDSGTATINSLVVHRYGVGAAAELTNVYLYDGASRLTGGRSVNADTQNVTFSNLSVAVSSTPKTLTVKADTAASSTGVHGFEIVSSGNITTTETVTISGTFPVKANQMTLSASAAGTATVAETTASLSAYLGESAAEVAKFRITAGARDITVRGITLTQGGVISNSDLTNFVLKRGTEELATADAIDSNDRLVLTLDSDYRIDAGVAKVFSLYADIIGGKTTDNIKFYVEETTDVNILDEVYLVGAGITNSWALADQTVTILGSTVTLGDNGPITGSVASNSTSVPISNYSVTVDRNVTVKISTVKIELKLGTDIPDVEASLTASAADAVASSAASGTTNTNITMDADVAAYDNWQAGSMLKLTDDNGVVTYAIVVSTDTDLSNGGLIVTGLHTLGNSSEVEEVNPFSYIKNIKLVNLDTGGTILGPTSYASTMTKSGVSNTYYSKTYTDSYDLAANTTTRFSIQVDVDNLMASGYSIYATIDYSAANSMKDVDANEYLAAADIVPNTLTGDAQTVTTSSLTVAKTATPVSNSFVVGQLNVPALGIALVAGSAKDISVNKMILRLYADDDLVAFNGSGIGDTAANTLVNSVTLVNAATDATYGPVNLVLVDSGGNGYTSGTDYYKATFTNMGLNIPKGTNVAFVAKVNLTGILATSPSYLAVDLVLATGIEAEDDTGSITPAGAAANLNLSATPDPKITITGAGTLTVTVDAGTPDAALLVTNNSTGSTVTKYKLHAVNEAFVVTGLKLKEVNGTSGSFDDDFTSVQITYPKNAAGDLETKIGGFIGGLSTFAEDSIGIYVPKDSDAYLTVKVTTNSIAAGADSGENPRVMLANASGTTGNLTNEFIAVGQASGTKLFGNVGSGIACNNTNVNEMVIRKTKPAVSKASASTTLNNGENILYAFTVGANANEDVSFRRVVFSSAISNAGGSADLTVGYFTFYRSSTSLTNKVTIVDQLGDNLELVAVETQASPWVTTSEAITSVIVTFATEEVISAGSSSTYYLKATVGGSELGDNITFRIADDVTNLGSTVVTAADFGIGDEGEVAAWSTTQKQVGSYSAKLTKDSGGGAGSTYVQFVPTLSTAITVADVTTLGASGDWSFWYWLEDTANDWGAQMELKFEDPDSDGYVDITIMPLQAALSPVLETWTEETMVAADKDAWCYYGIDPTDGTAFNACSNANVAAISTIPAAIDLEGAMTAGGDSAVTWVLARVRMELWEDLARTNYIDDVTINDVVYALEPMNLIWSDNSATSHTVNTLDWTNGYLVEILPTDPLTLSR